MKQKPILFDGESVRALLTCAKCGKLSAPFPCEHCGSTEFSKTQTRRLCNPQPPEGAGAWHLSQGVYRDTMTAPGLRWKPRYREGELGWVREGLGTNYNETAVDVGLASYVLDGELVEPYLTWRWKRGRLPGMFMPKATARFWVRFGPNRPPEQVQEISLGDVCAEGIWRLDWAWCCPDTTGDWNWKTAFRDRWNGIHGPDAWDKNRWVWPYQFERCEAVTK